MEPLPDINQSSFINKKQMVPNAIDLTYFKKCVSLTMERDEKKPYLPTRIQGSTRAR